MPKRGEKKSKALQKNAEALKGIPIVCESQVYDKVYYSLEKEGKLSRVAALLQNSSSKGLTLEQTFNIFKQVFSGYYNSEYNIKMFGDTIEKHQNLKDAWQYGTFGDIITNQLIKNKAISLLDGLADDNAKDISYAMGAIEKYNKLYNDEYIDKMNGSDGSKGINVNINFGDESDANEYE